MSLVDHLEAHLGRIERGWLESPDGDKMGFSVVECRPTAGHRWFSTLGLSNFALRCPRSSKIIRLELVFAAPESFGARNIPALMQNVGAEAIGLERAYLRGEVIGPRGSLLDGLPFTALYVAMPAYFPDSFHAFQDDNRTVVFAWLVPIMDSEAEFVAKRGWSEFEDVLEAKDPDLLDFCRRAVV
jgi:hypothetical protein